MYYQSLLLVHLLAVAFAFFAIGALSVLRILLARAETVREALALLRGSATVGMLMPIFAVVLLVSGLFLTKAAWSFTLPWVILAIVGLVIMSAIGGAVLKPRGAAIAKSLATLPQLTADARRALADPVGAMAENTNVALATAIVVLMVFKPSLVVSLVVFLGVPAIALAYGAISQRRVPEQLTEATAPEF